MDLSLIATFQDTSGNHQEGTSPVVLPSGVVRAQGMFGLLVQEERERSYQEKKSSIEQLFVGAC